MIIDFLINRVRFLRAKYRHKTLRLKIAGMPEFLSCLNRHGIPYVILRWHQRVPLTRSASRRAVDDVDFLIDETFQAELVSLATRHRGPVKCDFYGLGSQRGFAYNRSPYYPPALASMVLRDRVFLAPKNFYVPNARHHLLTFLYHLVYHKATNSGIPMSEADRRPADARGAGRYMKEAERIAHVYDKKLTLPRTLEGLYQYLTHAGWQMPLDLLMRWRVKDPWHRHIIEQELRDLLPWAQRLPELVCFVVRGDARQPGIVDVTLSEIEREYLCADFWVLSGDQVHSLTMRTRGGNWVEGPKNTPVLPHAVALCVPRRPNTGAGRRDHELRASLKRRIRRAINARFRQDEKLFAVHSTDNAAEAQYYLHVLYGEDRAKQCERIETFLSIRRAPFNQAARNGPIPAQQSSTHEQARSRNRRPVCGRS